jgi:hypothetical protein
VVLCYWSWFCQGFTWKFLIGCFHMTIVHTQTTWVTACSMFDAIMTNTTISLFMKHIYHIPAMTHGARCDSCGLCVDDGHMKAANKKFPCKPLTESGPVTHHHWIQGNLPLYSKCFVCGDDYHR